MIPPSSRDTWLRNGISSHTRAALLTWIMSRAWADTKVESLLAPRGPGRERDEVDCFYGVEASPRRCRFLEGAGREVG
jgi:hypothetical protein